MDEMREIEHGTTVYVKPIEDRLDKYVWRRPDDLANTSKRVPNPNYTLDRLRFVLRLALACNTEGIPYNIEWSRRPDNSNDMQCTIFVIGKVPDARPFPKPPQEKPKHVWKPSVWDAKFKEDVYYLSGKDTKSPGFVIEHVSGLSLVWATDSQEMGVRRGENADIKRDWRLTHTKSGCGFELVQSFPSAVKSLNYAISLPVDWTLDVDAVTDHARLVRDFGMGKKK